jgi:hypothetical protein
MRTEITTARSQLRWRDSVANESPKEPELEKLALLIEHFETLLEELREILSLQRQHHGIGRGGMGR